MALADPTPRPPTDPATRADIDLLRADLLREIERLRTDTVRAAERQNADMARMEARLLWRLLGGAGVIGALLALFRVLDLLP